MGRMDKWSVFIIETRKGKPTEQSKRKRKMPHDKVEVMRRLGYKLTW
jgi:hypothetical protein